MPSTFSRLALLIFFGLSTTLASHGQQLTGSVVTAADAAKPIPYATIGVKGKPIGTTADAAGNFALTTPADLPATDSAIISCIGYRSLRLTIGALRKADAVWALQPLTHDLQEVQVRHGRVSPAILGRQATGGSAHWTTALRTVTELKSDERGWEICTVLPIRQSCYLDNFNFYIEQNGFEPIRMRFMLYAVENGKPTRQLLTDDIQFTVPSQQIGWIDVDLRSYNIHLPKGQTVAAGIQWLQGARLPNATQELGGPGAFPSTGHRVALRDKSEDEWRTMPINVSMYLAVQQYEEGKSKAPAAVR